MKPNNRIFATLGWFSHLLYLSLLSLPCHLAMATIATTQHNLSVTGPGPLRAASVRDICIFCHTPHSSRPVAPLWNRPDPGDVYDPYDSTTQVASPGQPNGSSILCLSCHDGTIALGEVLSRPSPISMSGADKIQPGDPGYLGTDLSDDHPISFLYTDATGGELEAPGNLTGPIELDSLGRVQCTSCHDAHDDTYGRFLVMSNLASAICRTCHIKTYWSSASHQSSVNATSGSADSTLYPESTVANNACESCHTPHAAGAKDKQLLYHDVEVDNCKECHNGSVAAIDIMSEFNKTSSHPTGPSGEHDAAETTVIDNSRHSICADCHNPHAASATPLGSVPGPLNDVRGINLSDSEVRPITKEYQLCFRCHASSIGKPAPRTSRQINQTSVLEEFDTANPSFHPVAGPGPNTNVPSLIAPLTEADTMMCSDCHNNNNSSKAGGAGPEGPHGSIYEPILIRRYETADPQAESPAVYALCTECHSYTSILNDESFCHDIHLRGDDVPCNTCHDPHGISASQATTTNGNPNNTHLINFRTDIVFSTGGNLRYEDFPGDFNGKCWLSCHGKDHTPWSYCDTGGMMGIRCKNSSNCP